MRTEASIRPTFGFLTHSVSDEYGAALWQGIRDGFRNEDCNLLCFLARYSYYKDGSEMALNFDLVSPENVDGLVINGGSVVSSVGLEGFKAFCDQFLPLPMVSLSIESKGIPMVIVENYPGMYQIVKHLIVTHNCRHIACIRGPEGNQDADERYQAYLDALQAHQIPFDPELVVIGDFMPPSGKAAVLRLLNERKVTLDAVVAANDNMALSAMETLIEQGWRVPDEIAVVGFDDSVGSRCVTPPLTTVRQSYCQMGQQAAQLLLHQLAGKSVEPVVRLPAEVVVRESCGCTSQVVERAGEATATLSEHSLAYSIAACRTDVVRNVQCLLGEVEGRAHLAEQLVDICFADIQGESPGAFISTWRYLLIQSMRAGGELEEWHQVLSILRDSFSTCFHQIEELVHAEGLWQKARAMLSETSRRIEIYGQRLMQERRQNLQWIDPLIFTAHELRQLSETLTEGLKLLQIPRAYLVLYDNAQESLEWAHILLAYQDEKQIDSTEGRGSFRASRLLPQELWPAERIESLLVAPVYFLDPYKMREEHYGFLVLEAEPEDGQLYEELRLQICTVLKSTFLIQQLEYAYSEIHALNKKLEQENLRMSAELEISRRIQQMMLPSARELELIEGLDIVGFMQPAEEIGGDYYDVLYRRGTVYIGIGDITGHGLESGLLMLMTQTAIRTLIDHGETDLVSFLATLNRTLFHNIKRMGTEKMLTLAFINYQEGQIKLVGQHEEMLVIRQGGRVERVDTLKLGFPLGVEEDIQKFINEATITLLPGEGVVLYTDGITQAVNTENRMYGVGRLCNIIKQHWDKSPEAIKQTIIEDVNRHIGTQKIYDDLTLVVLKQQ